MREEAQLEAGDEHQVELEAFGVVHGHEVDGGHFVHLVGVGDKGDVIEEVADSFAALGCFGGGVDEFVEILEARFGFGRVLVFQHPAIAGAVEYEFEQIGQRRRERDEREFLNEIAEGDEGRLRARGESLAGGDALEWRPRG